MAEGRVKSVLLKDVGHLIPMEAVAETAAHAAEWIGKEMERWRREEGEFRREWEKKSKIEKATIDEEWRGHAKPPVRNNQSNGVGGVARADTKL